MYERSKGILKKISDSKYLTSAELESVELGLRITEIYDMLVNESIGVRNITTGDDLFELEYQRIKNYKHQRKYNYKIINWTDSMIENMYLDVKELEPDMPIRYQRIIAYPLDENDIDNWKSYYVLMDISKTIYRYEIDVSVSLLHEDPIYKASYDAEYDHDSFIEKIKWIRKEYCNEDKIDKIISDYNSQQSKNTYSEYTIKSDDSLYFTKDDLVIFQDFYKFAHRCVNYMKISKEWNDYEKYYGAYAIVGFPIPLVEFAMFKIKRELENNNSVTTLRIASIMMEEIYCGDFSHLIIRENHQQKMIYSLVTSFDGSTTMINTAKDIILPNLVGRTFKVDTIIEENAKIEGWKSSIILNNQLKIFKAICEDV